MKELEEKKAEEALLLVQKKVRFMEISESQKSGRRCKR